MYNHIFAAFRAERPAPQAHMTTGAFCNCCTDFALRFYVASRRELSQPSSA